MSLALPRPLEDARWTAPLHERLYRALPWIFLVLALAGALFTAFCAPPFTGPDEPAQLYRADLLNYGQVAGTRIRIGAAVTAGGPSDQAKQQAVDPFSGLISHPERTVDLVDYGRAQPVRVGGAVAFASFPNTAVYSPVLYLPQTAALAFGRIVHQQALSNLTLARAANALTCIAAGFAALCLGRRIRWGLFALLTLPMSLFLDGVLGQDGVCIALAALGAAVLSRGVAEDRPLLRWETLLATAAFGLVGLAKAPYLPLLAVMLLVPVADRRSRTWAVVAALVLAAVWHVWTGATVAVSFDPRTLDAGAQARGLLAHPLRLPQAALATLARDGWAIYIQAVGVLGWLDVRLHPAIYALSPAAVVAAIVLSTGTGRDRAWLRAQLAMSAAAFVSTGAIVLGLYLTWNTLGAPTVEGVQGRYFLPIAAAALFALEGARPLTRQSRGGAAAAGLLGLTVAGFALVGLLASQQALVIRYFLD